jgi:chitinase
MCGKTQLGFKTQRGKETIMDTLKVLRKVTLIPTKSFSNWLLVCFILLIANATCFASTVTLKWDPVDAADLAGYKVYYNADSAVVPFSGTGATQGAAPVDVAKLTTATISGLDPSHAYYFAVTAYSSTGVESSYSNIAQISELTAPAVAISYPANNASVTGTVSVSANASDNVGVTKVEYYVNGALQGTDTASPYLLSWNTSALTTGTYTLSAMAYDAAGNVGQSANVSVTVVNDTTAPTVTLTAPASGATVSGTVAIKATASDNIGVAKVEFYENGTLLTAGNVAPYTFSWDSTSIADGSYTLTAKAYDAAGNVQTSNSVVTVKNTLNDTTAPAVSAFSLPGTATALNVAVSSLSASDNVGVTGYLITESAAAPAAGASGWSSSVPSTFTFAGAGARTAYAWAKDAAGNVSAAKTASVTITIPASTTQVYTIADAMTALQVAVGRTTATADLLTRLDVAPYINGISYPNGKIDTGDVVVILSKLVGK